MRQHTAVVLESVLGGGDGAHTKKNECAEGDEGADDQTIVDDVCEAKNRNGTCA